MNITKILILAAVSALSINVGAAMAQGAVPPDLAHWNAAPNAIHAPVGVARVQAGSSDIARGNHVPPFNQNFGTLANPG